MEFNEEAHQPAFVTAKKMQTASDHVPLSFGLRLRGDFVVDEFIRLVTNVNSLKDFVALLNVMSSITKNDESGVAFGLKAIATIRSIYTAEENSLGTPRKEFKVSVKLFGPSKSVSVFIIFPNCAYTIKKLVQTSDGRYEILQCYTGEFVPGKRRREDSNTEDSYPTERFQQIQSEGEI